MKHTQKYENRARSGFTLIEIIVVITVLSILAGAAVPVAQKAIAAAARKSTRAELSLISDAALEYCRDTNSVPKTITDLEVNPNRADSVGWAGPYLTGALSTSSSKSGFALDAWSRDYRVVSATTFVVTSAGDDGTFGGADDIGVTVNFTAVRRTKTLAKLATINQAVTLYNAVYQSSAPLPANYSNALTLLVQRGFLPDKPTYLKDAWGATFVANPKNKAPLVAAQSTSIPAAP